MRNPVPPTPYRRRYRWDPVPLPPAEGLFHATIHRTAILRAGFLPRGRARGPALGGGTPHGVSLTGTKWIACEIARSLREAVAIAQGRLTLDDVEAMAQHDRVWVKSVTMFVGSWLTSFRDENPIEVYERFRQGWVATSPRGLIDPLPPGARPHPIARGIVGRDGVTRYAFWLERVDLSRMREYTFDFYRKYLWNAESAGIRYDPLFFSPDLDALAAVDPAEIDVLEATLDPATPLDREPHREEVLPRGAYTYEPGMDEFRVFDPAAIHVVGVADCEGIV